MNVLFRAGCEFVIETGKYEGAGVDVFQDIAKVVSYTDNNVRSDRQVF